MRTWWSLSWTFLRVSFLNEAAYREHFWLQIFQSLFNLVTTFVLVATVFSYTSTLNGWNIPELLALIGIYLLMGGCINLIWLPSMNRFMKDVRLGTLDYTLLKPMDTQALMSVQQVEIWKLVDILLGSVVLAIALIWSHARLGWWEALGFIVTLLAGGAIIYAFLFFLSTLVFWYTRIENILVIFQSTYEAGRWPITIYPGWLRVVLTLVVPVGVAVTLPAQALTGQLSWYIVPGVFALALVLLTGTRLFWVIGVKRYTGASS